MIQIFIQMILHGHLIYLSIEDIRHQQVTLGVLFSFIFFSIISCVYGPWSNPLSLCLIEVCFILLIAFFAYKGSIGVGDVLLAIGSFFMTQSLFLVMMCFAFLSCTVSLVLQNKKRTGFIPYMYIGILVVQVGGGILC